MAQFDVFENPDAETQQSIPFLLDVQSNLLDGLATCVVAPLMTEAAMGKTARRLNPIFRIRRTTVVMSTAELAGIPIRLLGPKVCSLQEHRDEIMDALDFLLTGF